MKLAKSNNGGGNLSKGFAISGVLYPILILVVFIIVQMLTMLGTRKMILDQNRNQLIDSLNSNGKVYTNEELTELITQLQNSIYEKEKVYTKEEVDKLIRTTSKEYVKTISLGKLNENTWYPVYSDTITTGYRRLTCKSNLGYGKPSWSTHDLGFTVTVDLYSQNGKWGGDYARTIVFANEFKFSNVSPVGFHNYNQAMKPIFYLRGGASYDITTDYETDWKIATSKIVFNSEYNVYIEPLTSNPGIKADSLVTIK